MLAIVATLCGLVTLAAMVGVMHLADRMVSRRLSNHPFVKGSARDPFF